MPRWSRSRLHEVTETLEAAVLAKASRKRVDLPPFVVTASDSQSIFAAVGIRYRYSAMKGTGDALSFSAVQETSARGSLPSRQHVHVRNV